MDPFKFTSPLYNICRPSGSDGKESVCNAGDLGLIPGSGRSPGRREWQIFLPEESHGQRSLVAYSLWGCKELDPTERLTLSLLLFSHEKCRKYMFLLSRPIISIRV